MTTKKEKASALQKAERTLGALSADELRALRREIDILLELWEAPEQEVTETINIGKSKPEPAGTQLSLEDAPQRGYLEVKEIKGNKYLYRRWAEPHPTKKGERVLRSKYLGKAPESGTS